MWSRIKRWAIWVHDYRAITIRRGWRFVAEHVGHRGAVMAFLTMLDILFGYSLGVEPGPQANYNLVLSLHAWSLVWFGVGVLLATGISATRDKFHYGIAVALKVAWSIVLLRAWMFEGYARGWVTALIWGGFAVLIFIIASWPEGSIRKKPLDNCNDGEE